MSVEAMKQALYLIRNQGDVGVDEWIAAEAALCTAIEQAEKREPIAYITGTYGGRFTVKPHNPAMVLPLNMALYPGPQPQQTEKQEPVANAKEIAECLAVLRPAVKGKWPHEHALEELACYATPQPQRQLIWLSQEDEQEIKNNCTTVACVIKAVKAKFKEKNA